ncbi:transposase [Escherichia coli]
MKCRHISCKSAVEPSVIAQVIINKYGDHLLCRQQRLLCRSDVGLPVSSMAEHWLARRVTAFSPLAALLQRELINRPVVHADETT